MNNNQPANKPQYRARINYQIRAAQVRVILEDGSSPGVMNLRDALKMAQELNLDLIEINPKAIPPVTKIANFGKMLYEEKKKQAAAKKNQKNNELKELTVRPNTDENDLNVKLNQAKEFIAEGNKVKFAVKFKGREITHPELGKAKLEWFVQQLEALISPNFQLMTEGKIMSVIISPK